MSLNPEPSQPQEREDENLPPKSYAEAAEENTDSHQANGTEEYMQLKVNGEDGAARKGDITPEELIASGTDGSPRSPVRHGHKRAPSLKSSFPPREKNKSDRAVVFEEFNDRNGHHLMSIKRPGWTEREPARHGAERKQSEGAEKAELVSGRRAGAGWQKSSIRFAPLNVPLQRRLQTLMVLVHTLSIAGTLTMFFFLCAIPLLWPILLPYLIYVLFSHAGTSGELSHRSDRFRRSPIWSLFASYFPARLHRTQELPPTRKYIFGYHPHGIISHGAFAAFATEALGFSHLFPGITNSLLTLDSNFRIPLYREYALRMGLASVSRESCENILSKGGPDGRGMGRAITIVVGGARESLDAQPHTLRLVLNRRKGFVKLAITTGADLVPVLAFGENELYEQFDGAAHPRLHRFQLLVKRVAGFTVPLFHARGVFNYDVGMMPYRRPLDIVVGRPIKVAKHDHPDNDTVNRVHAEYVAELHRIWDDWKDTFAKDRLEEMQIID